MSKKSVLFVCTANSARSQMAEALVNHDLGDRFEAYSAGTAPKASHPAALKVLAVFRRVRDQIRETVECYLRNADAAASTCP